MRDEDGWAMARKLKDDKWSALFDYCVFYGSWLWLPALVLLFSWWRADVLATSLFLVSTTIIAVCMYARFVEPRLLKVNYTPIDLTSDGYDGATVEVRVALFSDTHYGIYRNAMPLHRLRKRIEQEDVEVVLVPGDLTNHLRLDELDEVFREFRNFQQPVFAVLGNHDYGLPGWIMPDDVTRVLTGHGVRVLENESTLVTIRGVSFKITGLRDHYAGTADYDLLAKGEARPPHLVMAHNADAAHEYPHGSVADLTVSGHTHGGQIRLPFVYRRMIPTHHRFDQGLYHANGYKVYVSSGTGMDLLPARLFIPPSLDILTLIVAAGDDAI